MGCYEYREKPVPNRQGTVTTAVCSSHGDDMVFDGASLTGYSPIKGGNESSTGILPVSCECELES